MPTATTTEENLTPAIAARRTRSRGEDAVPAPGHTSTHVPADFHSVNGWGADLDPANRPSYPKELPSTVQTARGDVSSWQQPHTKVHLSNEHPNLTPAFGATVPPRGLSGMLRDYAYEYGEATNRHWMTLILADRVDIAESMILDLLRGRPDNYVAEKAWSAYWKYSPNRSRTLMKAGAAVGAVAVGVLVARALFDRG